MCLITRLSKPFIAKKDIVCYKYFTKSENGYYTPYLQVKVELGEKITADSKHKYNDTKVNIWYKYAIGEGFIHAVLGKKLILSDVCVKAIIPAGTEFYISDDCTEICARELMLTTDVIDPPDIPSAKIAIRELFADYFEGLFDSIKIDVGYYRLADGSYVNPVNLTDNIKDDIIGVVACIHNGKVHVISLDSSLLPWCFDYRYERLMVCKKQYRDNTSVENDFNGEGNTKDVLLHDTYNPERYPAFAWIADYETKGTKKGDWHIGAAGEIVTIGRYNQFKINIALALLDNTTMIDYEQLWSSSEYDNVNAWGLSPTTGRVYFLGNNKRNSACVRAFITFNT